MKIQLNGEEREVDGGPSLGGVLAELGFGGKPVVIEHNGVAVTPSEQAERNLAEGDQVEIIVIAAGG